MTTTTTKTEKPQLYLSIVEQREHGYYHLYGRIVTQKFDENEWRPWGVDDTYSDGVLYSGLRTSCQGDEQSRTRAAAGDAGAVYGYSCEYHDVYTVDLRKCKRMLKTLEKIDRGLDKLTEARGYVRSYGEYCGRIAEVFGCKGIVIDRGKDGMTRSGRRYDWMDVGDGVNRVNHLVYLWAQQAIEATRESA